MAGLALYAAIPEEVTVALVSTLGLIIVALIGAVGARWARDARDEAHSANVAVNNDGGGVAPRLKTQVTSLAEHSEQHAAMLVDLHRIALRLDERSAADRERIDALTGDVGDVADQVVAVGRGLEKLGARLDEIVGRDASPPAER